MRQHTIARNYAEAFLALARKANDTAGWGSMLQQVADAVSQDANLRHFLESPRVSAAAKNAVLGKAFADRTPRLFLRFLQQLVQNRRQMLVGEIATEYFALLDEVEGRVHAQVTLARPADEAQLAVIARELSRVLGKQVVPHASVNPAIIGGLVVKVGDSVMDGSVRRRLSLLRDRLVRGEAGAR